MGPWAILRRGSRPGGGRLHRRIFAASPAPVKHPSKEAREAYVERMESFSLSRCPDVDGVRPGLFFIVTRRRVATNGCRATAAGLWLVSIAYGTLPPSPLEFLAMPTTLRRSYGLPLLALVLAQVAAAQDHPRLTTDTVPPARPV